MATVRYDDSLAVMLAALSRLMNAEQIASGVIVRDVSGRLSFFAEEKLDGTKVAEIERALRQALGPYARRDRLVASGDDFGYAVLADPIAYDVDSNGIRARVVDRRLVGTDWLRQPAEPAAAPARIVFASLKGGVGRSTALSVVALHLSIQGKRVLVIDLDMEAPGISTMLLNDETLPRYGIVDALVENGLSGLDDSFMTDLVGASSLSQRSGKIDVIPAFGSSSLNNPADVLGKLARAYAEDFDAAGKPLTILDQVRGVIDAFSDTSRYDAILVDARAGLHETAASAILGLGAEILFFGLNEHQTFHGYQALFSHLARLRRSTSYDWLDQVTMVQAKASGVSEDQELFADRCAMLFQASGLLKARKSSGSVFIPAEPFRDVPWEDDATAVLDPALEQELDARQPLVVLDDERFKHYSPQLRPELMLPKIYESSFGSLLAWIDETLAAAVGEHSET